MLDTAALLVGCLNHYDHYRDRQCLLKPVNTQGIIEKIIFHFLADIERLQVSKFSVFSLPPCTQGDKNTREELALNRYPLAWQVTAYHRAMDPWELCHEIVH